MKKYAALLLMYLLLPLIFLRILLSELKRAYLNMYALSEIKRTYKGLIKSWEREFNNG